MNKLTKLLSVFVIAGAIGTGVAGVAGCNKTPENNGNKHDHHYTWVVDPDDANKCHEVCDAEGECDAKTKTSQEHVDDINNETKETGKDGKCDRCGAAVKSGEEPGPDKAGEDDPGEVTYETVESKANFELITSSIGSGVKTTENMSMGKFTTGITVYCENKDAGLKVANGNINTQNQSKALMFDLNGVDGKNFISFTAKGASSGTVHVYKVNDGGEDELIFSKAVTNQEDISMGYDFATNTAGAKVLTAGKYYIGSTGGSVRVGNVVVKESIAASDPASITVTPGVTDFLKGREFETKGLGVTLNYKNGRQDALVVSADMIDSSAVNMEKAGEYSVKVKYHSDKVNQDFNAEYKIKVYEIESIALETYDLNSSRVTQNIQQVFVKGSTFNSTNLGVVATAKCGESVKEFVLANATGNEEYSVSGGDTATAGKKTVTVTALDNDSAKSTYEIQVVDSALAALDEYTITVDAAAAVAVNAAEGTATVNTVNQALQLLKLGENVKDDAVKNIKIKKGEYKEKVEIDIPNVHLEGVIATGETMKDVVIWYDALALTVSHGGVAHSTDGSATVSIRSTAEGFTAKNITFKNYYNTNELYNESKKLGSNTQAVALLADCDKVIFENCFFTSYHDTLYAMRGRQIYEGCEIEGRTDYIFGYNATAYFHNCKINTIGADDTKNGGYITATKGCSSGEADSIEYGYIFDGCTFGADSHVTDGTVSLARGWDKYMRLMFMNSTFSAAYSHEAFGEATLDEEGNAAKDNKNDRYTNMNANPVAAQLFEYNNTGAGALTAAEIATAVKGVIANMCTIPTAEVAANYSDYTKIFAAKNGNLTYKAAWLGDNTRYKITINNASDEALGTLYVYKGVTPTVKEITAAITTPKGYMVDKLYTDKECTKEYVPAAATEAVTIYATVVETKAVTYTYTYDGTNGTEWSTEGSPVTTTSTDSVVGLKVEPTKSLVLTASGTKATVSATGFTTSSSNASKFLKIDFLDASGNVVGTLEGTTPAGKTSGDYTFEKSTIETTTAFASVKIYCGTSGKGTGIVTLTIIVE